MSFDFEELFWLIGKIAMLLMVGFYAVFSMILIQKIRYMQKTLINHFGKVFDRICWINLVLAIIIFFGFLLS